LLSALLGHPEKESVVVATRLASSLVGLCAVLAAVALVRRLAPEEPGRALIAAGLLLLLPVHVYMSAMLSEEILVSSLVSFALAVMVVGMLPAPEGPGPSLARVALAGVLAGLALLTKLSGLLVVAAGGLALLLDGWWRGAARRGALRAGVFAAAALAVGGWFYLRSFVLYGYFYPHGLEVHSLMQGMPPGSRSVLDYLRFPWAALADPDLLSPALLHSVWGTTYATIWFDGHRHFLPLSGAGVARAGATLGVLGLLPTVAFLAGCVRAAVRIGRERSAPDVLLLGLVVATLAGYVLFTWRNPWFVTVKGSFLLGLAVPFTVYASESLWLWARRGRAAALAIGAALLALWIAVAITFSYQWLFTKREFPGLDWKAVQGSWMPRPVP
jgi:hypothetical protein